MSRHIQLWWDKSEPRGLIEDYWVRPLYLLLGNAKLPLEYEALRYMLNCKAGQHIFSLIYLVLLLLLFGGMVEWLFRPGTRVGPLLQLGSIPDAPPEAWDTSYNPLSLAIKGSQRLAFFRAWCTLEKSTSRGFTPSH